MRRFISIDTMIDYKDLLKPVFEKFRTNYNELGKRYKGHIAIQDINDLIVESISSLQGLERDIAEGFLETVLGAMIGMGNSVDAFKTIDALVFEQLP